MKDSQSEDQLTRLTKLVVEFRNERDWEKFHNAKDLSLALAIEASELTECFLWKEPSEAHKEKVADELADVLIYSLLLANETGLNIEQIIADKLKKNAEKYPIDKAKGNARKYSEL